MDTATMKLEVRERLGETTEEDFWKDTHILRMLNEGLRRFSMEEKWPWLFTTRTDLTLPADSTTLGLETDIDINRYFSLVLVEGSTALHAPRRVQPGDGARIRVETFGVKDTPRWYWVERIADPGTVLNYVIRFAPQADKEYGAEYSYLRIPAALDSDDDIPDIPEAYQEAIIAYATGMLWLKELTGGGKAQEQFNIYQAVLQQARQEMKAFAIDEQLVWGKRAPEPSRPAIPWRIPNLPPNIGV